MESAYIAIAVFIAISIFEPVSFLIASISIRRKSPGNPIKLNNYESAEHSYGKRLSIMNEYLPYFPMFLAYEIILAIMLVWVLVAGQLTEEIDFIIFGLFAFGFIMEISILKIAKGPEE